MWLAVLPLNSFQPKSDRSLPPPHGANRNPVKGKSTRKGEGFSREDPPVGHSGLIEVISKFSEEVLT